LAIARAGFNADFQRLGAADCASPPQTPQVETFLPVPWHLGQTVLNFMRPPFCVIWPLPPHWLHLPGDSMRPLPRQLEQVSRREMFRRMTPPLMVSRKARDLVFEVIAGLGAFVLRGVAFAAKDAGEDIAETAAAASARSAATGAVGHVGKVEAAEVEASCAAASRETAGWPPEYVPENTPGPWAAPGWPPLRA